MASILWERVKDVRVIVSGDRAHNDADWDAHLEALRGPLAGARATLVVAGSGAPTASQRQRLMAVDGATKLPTAVVSSSTLARGVVAVLSWFGGNLRAFSPERMSDALDFIAVPPADRPALLQAVDRLKARLG